MRGLLIALTKEYLHDVCILHFNKWSETFSALTTVPGTVHYRVEVIFLRKLLSPNFASERWNVQYIRVRVTNEIPNNHRGIARPAWVRLLRSGPDHVWSTFVRRPHVPVYKFIVQFRIGDLPFCNHINIHADNQTSNQ
jgi:hypothetical protein